MDGGVTRMRGLEGEIQDLKMWMGRIQKCMCWREYRELPVLEYSGVNESDEKDRGQKIYVSAYIF